MATNLNGFVFKRISRNTEVRSINDESICKSDIPADELSEEKVAEKDVFKRKNKKETLSGFAVSANKPSKSVRNSGTKINLRGKEKVAAKTLPKKDKNFRIRKSVKLLNQPEIQEKENTKEIVVNKNGFVFKILSNEPVFDLKSSIIEEIEDNKNKNSQKRCKKIKKTEDLKNVKKAEAEKNFENTKIENINENEKNKKESV
ncbi:hypothetical protein EDEG_01303 [Edhazardia aedis USNM 41457]|uniref:Uncharacterized protein n=1 Tax=Edhazardia aedis (strain USNM 41457) TaxID=1003232 RepID=J8ZXL3_EDHAE|nr:hypothetical protein EDEG_01303 [Edhazardia aedis USNM 41457]|eukprot:EJW04433.1 hypothetical protein EDEG_01303 [Edhazardia aedis USNM 41457]